MVRAEFTGPDVQDQVKIDDLINEFNQQVGLLGLETDQQSSGRKSSAPMLLYLRGSA
jgi:hypothetical protein